MPIVGSRVVDPLVGAVVEGASFWEVGLLVSVVENHTRGGTGSGWGANRTFRRSC